MGWISDKSELLSYRVLCVSWPGAFGNYPPTCPGNWSDVDTKLPSVVECLAGPGPPPPGSFGRDVDGRGHGGM